MKIDLSKVKIGTTVRLRTGFIATIDDIAEEFYFPIKGTVYIADRIISDMTWTKRGKFGFTDINSCYDVIEIIG